MPRVIEHGNAILTSLCRASGARAAAVRDASSPAVWWQSRGSRTPLARAALDNLLDAIRPLLDERPLHQGHRLRACRADQPPHGLVHSFAGIYLVLLVFDAPFNRFVVEPHLRRALPLLEQLVPRLPPLDGDPAARGGRARRRPRPI